MINSISDIVIKEEYIHVKKLSDFFIKLKTKLDRSKKAPILLQYIYLALLKKKSLLYIKIKDSSSIHPFLLLNLDKSKDWEDMIQNDSYSNLDAIDSFYNQVQKIFEFNKTKLVQDNLKLRSFI